MLGQSSPFTVNPGAAASFVVSGFTNPVTAGTAGSVTVTAEDAYGNVATGYTGTVAITSSDAQAVLPSNYQFTANDAGVHVFSVTLKTAGSQSITATDTVTSSITGSQTGITVNAGALASVSVSGPSSVIAGGTATFTATGFDAEGNSLGVQTASWSITGGAAGSWSGNVYTSYTAGSWTVSALVSGVTGTASLTVNAGALASVSVSGPSSVIAGGTATFTATGFDAEGNSLGVQTASWSITGGAAGSWSGNVYTSYTAGSWTVSALVSGVTGTASLTVNAGALASVSVSGPSSVIAGGTATFTATGFDAEGNSLGVQTASWSITGGAAGSWSGNVYTSYTAGSWTVSALVSGVTGTAPLTVNPGVFANFVFGTIGQQTAGTAFTVTVTAEDAFGNIVTSYGGSATFSDLSGSLNLASTGSWSAGVYTGSVTITTAYTNDVINVTNSSPLVTGLSTPFTVTANSATKLVFTAGAGQSVPINTVSSVITVSLEDQYGNLVNAPTEGVTVTLTSGVTTGTFYSSPTTPITTTPVTITIPAGSSSASFYFSDTAYQILTLTASSTGSSLTPATTTFTITQYELIFVPSTGAEPVGPLGANSIKIEVIRDTTGGVHYGGGGQITVTLSTSSATGEFVNAAGTQIFTTTISSGYYYGQTDFYYIDTSTVTPITPTLTATSPGYTSGTAQFTIYTPVLSGFNVTASGGGIIGTQATGEAFGITITAIDQYGNTFSGYTGTTDTNTLTESPSGTISPTTTTGGFTAGVWTGSVTLNTAGTGISISTSGGGAKGQSNTFTVYTPVLSSFSFSNIYGTKTAGTSFSVTITAHRSIRQHDPNLW